MSSNFGMQFQQQNLLMDILEPVAEKMEGIQGVASTSDMLPQIADINTRIQRCEVDSSDLTILATDAMALFLSMQEEFTTKVIEEAMQIDDMEYEGMSW